MTALTRVEAARRFAAGRVAVLATLDAAGRPHLVPVTFVVAERAEDAAADLVWSAVDDKPKRSLALQRHRNIGRDPRVSLLVQHWDDDWSRLWWVRADGTAAMRTDPATVARAAGLLRGKYPQYAEMAVGAPVIEVTVTAWRGWAAGS